MAQRQQAAMHELVALHAATTRVVAAMRRVLCWLDQARLRNGWRSWTMVVRELKRLKARHSDRNSHKCFGCGLRLNQGQRSPEPIVRLPATSPAPPRE